MNRKQPKYIREEKEIKNYTSWKEEMNKPVKLLCMCCGYTWDSKDGNKCVMCNEINNIEL